MFLSVVRLGEMGRREEGGGGRQRASERAIEGASYCFVFSDVFDF